MGRNWYLFGGHGIQPAGLTQPAAEFVSITLLVLTNELHVFDLEEGEGGNVMH